MIAAESLDEQREAWIARAVAHGMSEADARQTAARMASFAAPAPAKVPRKRAAKAQPVADVLATRPRKARTGPHKAAQALPAAQDMAPIAPALERASGAQATLPGFSDDLRAIPNHLARSPLFAPIKRGQRVVYADEQLPSPAGVVVRYSGPALDQADCDVFMQLVYEGRSQPVGRPLTVVRHGFLSAIGRADGGKNYQWLQAVFDRLQVARVRVENQRYRLTTQLIGKVIEDRVAGTYEVTLDPHILQMFAPTDRSLIDWQKRLKLERRVDLAKWLHNFTASHADAQQFHSLDNLRAWSGYQSPPRKFREALEEALCELVRVEVIADPEFYERRVSGRTKTEAMVKWTRL